MLTGCAKLKIKELFQEQELLHSIVHYNRPKDSKMRLISAGICILVINITGYMLGNYSINSLGTLGVFTFLHYSPNEKNRIMKRLIFVGMCIILSHALGMISTLSIWLPPLTIGVIAFGSRLLFRIFQIDKPGDIFIILVAAAGSTNPLPLEEMPMLSLYVTFGVVISVIMGYVTLKVEGMPKQSLRFNTNIMSKIRQDPRVIVDSFYYAAALFFASYVNIALGLGAYSWIVVSCSAILQGNTLLQIVSRNFQRIIGTICGLISAVLLLSIPIDALTKITIVVIFYMIVEYFMPRNYSIAIFFVTNMVLLQMTLNDPYIWPELLKVRFLGIIIGSLLGVVAAVIQYRFYHFYSQSIINERTYDGDLFTHPIDEVE